MNCTFAAFTPLFAAAEGIPDNLLPIILGGMAIAVIGMGLGYTAIVTDARIERARHEAIRAALEKGLPIPPELVSPRDRVKSPDEDRRIGVILLAVSVGIFVFLSMLGIGRLAYVAVIPGCLGVAYLVNWFLEHRASRKLPPDARTG